MRRRLFQMLCYASLFISLNACGRREVHSPAAPLAAPASRNYEDLEAGGRLRIVQPLLAPGKTQPALSNSQVTGATITLSALGLIGYQTAYYAITGKRGGHVRLTFLSAETSKDGVTTPLPRPPSLPFPLPRGAAYIRLIYLQRVSQSDHNMAIVSANRMNVLDAVTKQIENNQRACATTPQASCSWVPSGIAVRPEKQAARNSTGR
jgi:hypothetical protein